MRIILADHSAVTPENMARVHCLIEEDSLCTYERIKPNLDVGSATMSTILHCNTFTYRMLSPFHDWIPKGKAGKNLSRNVGNVE